MFFKSKNFNLVSSSYSLSTIFNDVHHQKNYGKSFSNTLELEEYQWNLVIWGIRPMTSTDTRTEFYGKSDSMLFHILRGLDVTRVTLKREVFRPWDLCSSHWINVTPCDVWFGSRYLYTAFIEYDGISLVILIFLDRSSNQSSISHYWKLSILFLEPVRNSITTCTSACIQINVITYQR